MNLASDLLAQLLPFKISLIALGFLCLTIMIQSFLTAPLAFIKEEQVPGLPLKGDHTVFSFRVLRVYVNSVENLPAFGFAVLLAIFAGVNPTLLNWLAVTHVAFRMAFWGIYYSGIGKVAGGPRTMSYVGGLIANIAILVACLWKLIQ